MHTSNILVVDQRPHFSDALAGTSLGATKRFEHVDHTEPALALLEQGDVDVVICDSGAPGMPGADFLAAVAMRWPRVVRMLIVDDRSLEAILPAVNAGEIERFFTRPPQAAQVMIELEELLLQRQQGAAVPTDTDADDDRSEGGGENEGEPAAVTENVDTGVTPVISLDGDAAMGDLDDLLAEFRAELDQRPRQS